MNRTKLITPLMLVALLLTSCQVAPAPPPAAPATVTEEATPTAEATEEAAPSAEITTTEAMTPTEEITPTEEMTAAVSVPFEAIQIILEYDPGSWSPPHTHGGPTLATVLEGEVTVRKKATGAETVYGAGEFFTEGVGEVFGAGNAGQEKARLAALFLLPEGANLILQL